MSGIVGIINLDGAPVDQDLLRRMTDFMSFRGPDAQETWIDGNVGFGHTMLRTTFEAETEKQPLTLDGKVWLTADARIDGRDELIAELEGKLHRKLQIPTRSNGHGAGSRIPNDAELILYSYEAWAEDCVKHLIGDFAFAIWDSRKRQLFCARDHFGIKPFFYGGVGNHLVFGNTLNCLRMHPAISDKLNEQAIADFLLFGSNRDLSTTVFADIQRLPPAHYSILSEGELLLRSYWTLPVGDLIKYRRKRDYIDHFLELLRAAVADRMRFKSVGVLMSGGLDSTAVAAIAKELQSTRSACNDLQSHTAVYDRLFPDQERYYAGMVSDTLKIPLHYLVADDFRPYQGWELPELRQPEPVNSPFLIQFLELTKQLSAGHRVVLTGSDGDTFFGESSSPYFHALFKRQQFGRLLADLIWYACSQRELPRVGFRSWLRQVGGKQPAPASPTWLKRSFATRLNLSARWAEVNSGNPAHPIRPRIYRVLSSPIWSQHFESYDAGWTLFPVEYRHPLVDLRLLAFALSVPPVPWLVSKELLRAAMRGMLPDEVCARPKSPLSSDPLVEHLRLGKTGWVDDFSPVSELTRYVHREAIPGVNQEEDSTKLWMNLRPLSFNYWLSNLTPTSHESESEERNEYHCYEQVG